MAIQGSDSIVVHRGGADYRTEASELIAGKGNIQLKQGNTELGRFNVNQSNDQLITIPESEITSINGQTGDVIIDANDLNIEFPVTSVNGMTGDVLVVGGGGDVTSVNGMTGDVTVDVPVFSVNGMTGDVLVLADDLNIEFPVTSVNGNTGDVTVDVPVFSVNGQTGDVIVSADDLNIEFPVTSVNGNTGDVTVDVPVFSVNGQTGDVVVDIPDVPVNSVNGQSGDVLLFLNDLQDVSTVGVTNDQLLGWNGTSWVPTAPVSMPPSSALKGFIDVATAAPAASAGDLWIHHKNPAGSSVAAGSWTGIAGQTIDEGTYVIYSTDNQWYAGNNANDLTQIQSDWNEIDTNDAAFIRNKPTIGDGDYNLSAGAGVYFSGDSLFSANQSIDAALEIGIDTVWFNNQANTAVGKGNYTVSADTGIQLNGDLSFNANQSSDAVISVGVDSVWLNSQIDNSIGNSVGEGDYNLSAGAGVYFSGDALFNANQSTDAALEIGVDSIWFNNEIDSALGNKIGDGTYTVSTDAGITASGDLSFSANQSTDAVLNLGVDSLWFNSQISSEVGNASIMFTGGQGIKVTGDTPTANQKTYSNTSFAVDVGNGLAFNTSDQLVADLQFIENNISASGGLDEAPTDGNLYVRKGDTESWLRGLPYDISTLPPLS